MEFFYSLVDTSDISALIWNWALIALAILTIYAIIRLRKEIVEFINSTRVELTKVEWLRKKATLNFTIINIAFIVATTGLVFLLDQGFLILRNLVI